MVGMETGLMGRIGEK